MTPAPHELLCSAERIPKPAELQSSRIADLDGVRRFKKSLDCSTLTTMDACQGHSWGASEAVNLARTLRKESVPILLTIQVDSVSKPGKDDKFIPANVAQAINFYQLDRLLHGQRQIVAADPLSTQILGNFRFDYKDNPINCDGYPWYARIFMKPHIEIESDPKVWNRVESLIRSKLPPASVSSTYKYSY
jgi:hypothetical protein